jgi:hypothetical protein
MVPDVFEDGSFENFQFKPAGRDTGVGGEQFAEPLRKTGVLQMVAGNIDAD